MFEDIIEEVKKPDSLENLARKFGLPLRVKCVKDFYRKSSGENSGVKGLILNFYMFDKEDFGHHDGSSPLGVFYIKSKKFILWE